MVTNSEPQTARTRGPGPFEILAIIVFAANVVVFTLASPFLVMALAAVIEWESGDGAIGALALSTFSLRFSVPALLIAFTLARLARRLQTKYRVLSVLPPLIGVALTGAAVLVAYAR